MEKKDKSKEDKIYKRHIRFWKIAKVIIGPFLKLIYRFSYEIAPKIDGAYLVLSNHNTDLDPALVALSFPRQMYFVASEHVYRAGFISKVLHYVFEPIAKIKGSSDALTVMKTIRTLRSGKNVCIFPEGNRSYNGKTGTIIESTGKLVKAAGVSLVTYKLEGGYFTTPRWGFGIRRGKMHGSVVNIYSPEQIKQMDPKEITEVIVKDLAENAYERQNENPIQYKGKKLAEGLECAISVCPVCKKIDTLQTHKDSVSCKECGTSTKIDSYGNFLPDFNFRTVEEWDSWQDEFYAEYYKSCDSETILFSDENVCVNTVTSEHETKNVGSGKICMYKEKFVFEGEENTIEFDLNQISDMSIYGRKTLVFTDGTGAHYEVKSEKLINVRKYLSIYNLRKTL